MQKCKTIRTTGLHCSTIPWSLGANLTVINADTQIWSPKAYENPFSAMHWANFMSKKSRFPSNCTVLNYSWELELLLASCHSGERISNSPVVKYSPVSTVQWPLAIPQASACICIPRLSIIRLQQVPSSHPVNSAKFSISYFFYSKQTEVKEKICTDIYIGLIFQL